MANRFSFDTTRILDVSEIETVVTVLHRKRRAPTYRVNLIIFRLSCCYGLRRKEIVGLQMRDVITSGPRPHIIIRPENTKGQEGKRRRRIVPMWWSAAPMADLVSWREQRLSMGAGLRDPFVCSLRAGHIGEPIPWSKCGGHWDTALLPLPPERRERLSIHAGRHTFISHALAAGRRLAEVRDAAGHSSIAITDVYTHAIDSGDVPDIFSV